MKIETVKDAKFPPEIQKWITSEVYSQNGMNAETFFSGDVFIKTAPAGGLAVEAEMTRWFYKNGLGAEVLDYVTAEKDYLVTRRVPGEDGTTPRVLAQPEKLAREHGKFLRRLHDTEFPEPPQCGITRRYIDEALETYRKNPPTDEAVTKCAGYFGITTAAQAAETVEKYRTLECEDVVIHGDFCLPNVLYDENINPTGFVDLGGSGRGDRHFDLFWGVWSLGYNLLTNDYAEIFLESYGRDVISQERLELMAAVSALLAD